MAGKKGKQRGKFEIPELSNASKTLFANICFASVDEDIKTLVVTSSAQDEGKTTVSTNLACAAASSGKKVLLVEADMRRRCIASLLGTHSRYGLVSVLLGRSSIEEAVISTGRQNLYFLDSEPNVASPIDLLLSKRFRDLVEDLSEKFDYVIFDAPPVGLFADAAAIGSAVDGSLLVVRERFAKQSEVASAIQQMRASNSRIIGAVMTFTSKYDSDYYDASYYQEKRNVSKPLQRAKSSASTPSASGAVSKRERPTIERSPARTDSLGGGQRSSVHVARNTQIRSTHGKQTPLKGR